MTQQSSRQVAVVGLGYVGLSLAVALAPKFNTIGFDVDSSRIRQLKEGYDRNGMASSGDLVVPTLRLTDDPSLLGSADFVVIAVPTPVDDSNAPDLTALEGACRIVGQNLKPNAVVVLESTVYPGCTEEVCIPVLERESGLVANRDFGVGYSPERIDPGDPNRSLDSVVKVISAGTAETCEILAEVYGSVVSAGLYRTPDIRTAEAAKVIENVQRDLNIALINEFAILFHRLGLDTKEVLDAAGTKWNFLPFFPGLVGGHCIPVDPYYLVHKATSVGEDTAVILAGRQVNDGMAAYVAAQAVQELAASGRTPERCSALVLGLTFKEDVRDARNSQAIRIGQELERLHLVVKVSDPLLTLERMADRTIDDPFAGDQRFDLVLLAVPHRAYREIEAERYLGLFDASSGGVFVDVRGVLDPTRFEDSGVRYWRL